MASEVSDNFRPLEGVVEDFLLVGPPELDDGAVSKPNKNTVLHEVTAAPISHLVECYQRENGVLEVDIVVPAHVREAEDIHGASQTVLRPHPQLLRGFDERQNRCPTHGYWDRLSPAVCKHP